MVLDLWQMMAFKKPWETSIPFSDTSAAEITLFTFNLQTNN